MQNNQLAEPSHSPFDPPLPQKASDKILWGNLHGCSTAVAMASALRKLDGISVVIVSSTAEADRLESELRTFLKTDNNDKPLWRFADWETLPYDSFSPHQDIISERMRTLYQLLTATKGIVLVSAPTLLQQIPPTQYIIANSLSLEIGQTLNIESFRGKLNIAGYHHVDTVFQHGEYAVRGAIIDIFPMGSDRAYRIELFDDEIDSLRTFDPETQRTIDQVTSIELLPAKECPLDKTSIARFKNQWHEKFDADHRNCMVYQDVSSGHSPAGVEYFLPLFFEQTATLFDYLPDTANAFIVGELEVAVENFWREAHNRYESRCGDRYRPILPPKDFLISTSKLFAHLKPFARINIYGAQNIQGRAGHYAFTTSEPPQLHFDARSDSPTAKLESFILGHSYRILFCAESTGRREALIEQLQPLKLELKTYSHVSSFLADQAQFGIVVAPIETGMIDDKTNVALIAETQLYGLRVQQRRRKKGSHEDQDAVIRNLTELKLGAPVVHLDHGVGRYKGLQSITVDEQAQEFLVLEYADNATLYVPVASLNLISRYSGADEEHAPLHKLGSEQWQKARKKAAEQIRDVAAELLEIYAKRQARRGIPFADPEHDYDLFASTFPFEETPDQETAIAAVRKDMLSPQPMDRLVCGDVGFGKTEVAMRAAFIAVQSQRQVAVLVPTTLLAQQHFENFRDRFSEWPVNVDLVSRFKSNKDIETIQKKLKAGQIDILIGTHKLLQSDMTFSNLGLLIIDEEHRFGVRQKEAIKALRAEVDILTMTATPIPRTLNMAMNGIRDLSIIATPPAKRLSIKTFVRERDEGVIKEAIQREIMRGGQVYYLYNEVKTIDKAARELGELIPEARIQVGHGQMRERQLEAVMSDFYHKRFNVLVCTTIIETGIDVPTANTIIIERADKFGLAQLHQLRGRVGRSHHQAYAYLLTPNAKVMTNDAHKRLLAIEEAQDLGAGFMLASHDLEIRGAGELLGEDQSGQMQAIGFSLYMDMLDRAVKAIQKGEIIDLENDTSDDVEINLRIPALIPEDYLPDVHSRLIMYKRLSGVAHEQALDDLQVEMIDRFGLLPDAVKNLVRVTRLKLWAKRIGVTKIETAKDYGKMAFGPNTKVEPLTIVKLVQNQPQTYRLDGATALKFTETMETPDDRIKMVQRTLEALYGRTFKESTSQESASDSKAKATGKKSA